MRSWQHVRLYKIRLMCARIFTKCHIFTKYHFVDWIFLLPAIVHENAYIYCNAEDHVVLGSVLVSHDLGGESRESWRHERSRCRVWSWYHTLFLESKVKKFCSSRCCNTPNVSAVLLQYLIWHRVLRKIPWICRAYAVSFPFLRNRCCRLVRTLHRLAVFSVCTSVYFVENRPCCVCVFDLCAFAFVCVRVHLRART